MRMLKMSSEDWREIFSMSGPIFIEQLSMALIVTLVSMLVKGSGIQAVASVNLLSTLNMLFQQSYMAIGVAVTVTVAQFRGRGDLISTGETASQANTLSLLLSSVVAILCMVFMNPILRLILANSETLVYTYSRIYLFYNILSLPFMSIYYISTAALRGSGFASKSLVATLINNGAYAAFSVLSVVLFHGGLKGVSVAMLLARILAAAVGLIMLKQGNVNLKVTKLFALKFEKRIIKPVIAVSIPICLENILFQGGKLITQTFAVPFGTNAIAVNGIANTLFSLLMVPGVTCSNSATPIVGRYIGMRDFPKARQKLWQFLFIGIVVSAVSSAVILALTGPMARYYSSVAAVQKEIFTVTLSVCVVNAFLWPASFIVPSGLRGSGDVKYTTFIAVLSMILMRIAIGYVFAIVLKFGVIGIWIGMYFDWLLRSVLFLLRARGDKWLQKSVV